MGNTDELLETGAVCGDNVVADARRDDAECARRLRVDTGSSVPPISKLKTLWAVSMGDCRASWRHEGEAAGENEEVECEVLGRSIA